MSIFDWFRKPQTPQDDTQTDHLIKVLEIEEAAHRYAQRIMDGEDRKHMQSLLLDELGLERGSAHGERALTLLTYVGASADMSQAVDDYQAVLDAEAERYASKERRKVRRKVRKTVHSI